MPRQARRVSSTGVYHIMVRGVNRQDIFSDEEDYRWYLETLKRIATESNLVVLGYCLMSNHVHLLIDENLGGISNAMKRIGISYAYWYNLKYQRSGHVFQGRFKSEPVEDDLYLKTVIRYIHQNPVKAGISKTVQGYHWSSCRAYYGQEDYPNCFINTDFILGLFASRENEAVEQFRIFMEEKCDDECLEDSEPKRISDEEAERIIVEFLQGKPLSSIREMPRPERNKLLRKIKQIEGISLRQISRLTGMGTTTVHKT